MSFYINIDYGTTSAGIRTVSEKAIAIIGKSTAFSGIAYNVQSLSDLSGAVAGDPLYDAVEDALAAMPGDTMIIAAGLPAAGQTYTMQQLNRAPDYWYTEYSPLTGYSNEKIYATDVTQLSGAFASPYSGFYDIVSGLIWEKVTDAGTNYTGKVTVDASGLVITDGTTTLSGYIIAEDDKLYADITTSALGEIFEQLSSPQYRFQFFVFAYPNKPTPVDPQLTDDFKYKPEYCINGSGWLDDIATGDALAHRFNAVNQRTLFVASLPDGVSPDTLIGLAYLNGTGVPNTVRYRDMPLFNQSEWTILVQANVYQPENIDPAIQMVGTRMNVIPRRSSLFAVPAGNTMLAEIISQPVINKWRNARINVISTSRASDTPVWHGNFTMSSDPKKGTINYMQVINLLAYDLEMALYGLLYSPQPMTYDLDTIIKIEDTIRTVCQQYTETGYIDGYIGTTIPIKTLLMNESSLTPVELAVLEQARASGVIDNIVVTFRWAGDIVKINITLTGGSG